IDPSITSMRSGRVLIRMILAVAIASAGTTSARSQTITGHVLDSLSGAPVARGFAVLLDASGAELDRTLTTSDGTFSFSLESPGSYVIRSQRIGYAAGESALLTVARDQALTVTLRVRPLAQLLATIEVRGEARCGDPEDDPGFGALWTEARKALEAAAWTNRQAYTHLLHGYRRVRGTRWQTVEYERSWQTLGFAVQPFASIPAERLARYGFVVMTGGRRMYYGPDANVLLHQSFQENHCFEAVTGEREFEGLIGLAFSPVPEHELPDIEGVLWIDPEAYELRRIEYRYTNLEHVPTEDDRIGGSIYFKPLSSGAWVLEEWQIRTPVMEYRTQRDGYGGWYNYLALVGIGEEGGKIIEVADDAGETVYMAPDMAYVTGTVLDESSGTNLTNHFVNIVGTGYTTHTDPNGIFFFKTLLSGPHTFTTAKLDSLGYVPGRVTRWFVPRDTLEVQLVIPDSSDIWWHACPQGGLYGLDRAVVGFVHDALTGEPLPNRKIVATWRPERMPEAKPIGSLITTTDSVGSYRICGLPTERTTRIELDDADYHVAPVELTFRADWVVMENRTPRRGQPTPYRIWKVDLLAIRKQ
ncbi:MAG: carboxypeptidase regulatory-like domain-containing protein, partial [Gemmatimonadota bacterium]